MVGALLRNVKERAPDAVVGRIFTAVNQDGLVVLVGEAGEPENGGDAHANGSTEATSNGAHHVASNGTEITSANGRAPRHRVLTDCHISVCTLDQPVNLGAPDGRNARAVFLVMVPEVDFTAPWAEGLDRYECLRTIKTAFQRSRRARDLPEDGLRGRTQLGGSHGEAEARGVSRGAEERRRGRGRGQGPRARKVFGA